MGTASTRAVVLDGGALVALERADSRIRALIRLAVAKNGRLIVPAPVVSQAWRDGVPPEEYLALEEKASSKHEYLDGVVYSWQGFVPLSMAGGSKQHNLICQNICLPAARAAGDGGMPGLCPR